MYLTSKSIEMTGNLLLAFHLAKSLLDVVGEKRGHRTG